MINNTAKALKSLLGDAAWSLSDEDLSTLVIHTQGVTAPTEAAVKAEIKRLADEEAAKPAAKAALLEKLGITAEEASLLLA
jgi:hypothetical protein